MNEFAEVVPEEILTKLCVVLVLIGKQVPDLLLNFGGVQGVKGFSRLSSCETIIGSNMPSMPSHPSQWPGHVSSEDRHSVNRSIGALRLNPPMQNYNETT